MFAVTQDAAIAIHRANHLGGREGAMAEMRRRWPGIAERALPEALDRILAIKVAM